MASISDVIVQGPQLNQIKATSLLLNSHAPTFQMGANINYAIIKGRDLNSPNAVILAHPETNIHVLHFAYRPTAAGDELVVWFLCTRGRGADAGEQKGEAETRDADLIGALTVTVTTTGGQSQGVAQGVTVVP